VNISFKILILGSAISLTLAAQDARFGVQGALSLPANDLASNADTGLQLGGHARWAFNGGHGVMARADLTFYGRNQGVNVTDAAIAGDYTYHFARRQEGPYLLGGLSLHSFRTSVPGYAQSDSGLGLDLGGGYDFDRNLGLQARYTTNNLNDMVYSALNLGVTYTF